MSSFEPYKIYWNLYGGIHALVRSIYLWAAVGLTLCCSPFWLEFSDKDGSRPSAELIASAAPSLMAFTLSGMAIVLALSGGKFLDAIRQNGKLDSLFMKLVALFFHFIVVQTISFILAIISKTYPSSSYTAAAMFFFFSYGVMSAMSLAAMLLNVARIYNFTGGRDD
jgi:uncharacterized membrane protein